MTRPAISKDRLSTSRSRSFSTFEQQLFLQMDVGPFQGRDNLSNVEVLFVAHLCTLVPGPFQSLTTTK